MSEGRSLDAKCYQLLRDLTAYERELRDVLLSLHEYRARVNDILMERGRSPDGQDVCTEVEAWLARDGVSE